MKKNGKNSFKKSVIFSIIILVITFVYAIIRYNVIKGIPWQDLPLFISNKAIALAAVVFIALSFVLGPLARVWPGIFTRFQYLRKYFGLLGFSLGAVHAFISLLIFTPAYYPRFFTDAKLNIIGELSMLFGVISFFIFLLVAISDIPSVERSMKYDAWLKIQRTGYLALFFVLLHVFVMGFEGWFKPETWPGGLLPISLIAFIITAITLLSKIVISLFPEVKK